MKRFTFLIPVFLLSIYLQGSTHTVCAAGCDQSTIAEAIAAAAAGDTILLQTGFYTESGLVIAKDLEALGLLV